MSRNTCGEDRYKVWIEKKQIGEDFVYHIGGGEKPHIGAITLCEPKRKLRTMELRGHSDGILTEIIAKAASEKYGKKVVCIGGVHIDNASKGEIKKIIENCRGLIKWI